MDIKTILGILIFPSGLALMILGLYYTWIDRKFLARLQGRLGPRWYQPIADIIKLLAKEEIVPDDANALIFHALPIVGFAGTLAAALYVPVFGLNPLSGFEGDLIVVLYLLSMLTMAMGLAGANTNDRFSRLGSTRALTQVFAYEAPFMLALLGPSLLAGSWNISVVLDYTKTHPWMLVPQFFGFVVAVIGLMGKLELPPFDAPEAETEIVAGALTEYSGRSKALFNLGKGIELVVGVTLVAAFYMGGIHSPIDFFLKTLGIILVIAIFQAIMTRLRIDQTVGVWWRWGILVILVQWAVLLIVQNLL